MPALPTSLALWRDRRGRLSALRVATLAVLLWPVVLLGYDAATRGLGSRPLNDVIHRSGWWALIFLIASLAITPLRRATRAGKLIDVRRMIGVAAGLYALVHLGLYVADQGFSLVKVATEIVSRLYLTIGFVALVALTILTATSNDTAVKRLGGMTWRRLHQLSYLGTVLALVHFFQQTKADVTVPTLYAGIVAWLFGYRILARTLGEAALSPAWLAALAVAAAAVTFLGEAVGIAIAFRQPVAEFVPQFLGTAFDTDLGVRPGWWVLAAGLAVVALDLVAGRSKLAVDAEKRRPAENARAGQAASLPSSRA